MRKTRIAFLALALVGLLSAPVALADSGSEVEISRTFCDETTTAEYKLDAPSGATSAQFRVNADVGTGQVRFRLLDPSGTQRLAVRGDGGRVRGDTGSLVPETGTWRLVVEFEKASGNFRFSWNAK